MRPMNPVLVDLLAHLRQHPAFKDLLTAVEAPRLPPFKTSQAQDPHKAFGLYAYHSGRRYQHDAWLELLTGAPPKEIDSE